MTRGLSVLFSDGAGERLNSATRTGGESLTPILSISHNLVHESSNYFLVTSHTVDGRGGRKPRSKPLER